jgi:hypothetical protein
MIEMRLYLLRYTASANRAKALVLFIAYEFSFQTPVSPVACMQYNMLDQVIGYKS